MRCGRVCLVAGLVLLAAGCRTTTQSEKFVTPGYNANPTKLVVAYYLTTNAAIMDISRLEQRLSEGLARCGVQPRTAMMTNMSYGGVPTEHLTGANADVDGVLVLSEGSNGMARFAEAMMGGRRGESAHTYQVGLFDRQSLVWKGQVTVAGSGFLVYKPQEKADNFAQDLVGYLAADGILKGCPKPPAS